MCVLQYCNVIDSFNCIVKATVVESLLVKCDNTSVSAKRMQKNATKNVFIKAAYEGASTVTTSNRSPPPFADFCMNTQPYASNFQGHLASYCELIHPISGGGGGYYFGYW